MERDRPEILGDRWVRKNRRCIGSEIGPAAGIPNQELRRQTESGKPRAGLTDKVSQGVRRELKVDAIVGFVEGEEIDLGLVFVTRYDEVAPDCLDASRILRFGQYPAGLLRLATQHPTRRLPDRYDGRDLFFGHEGQGA